MGQRERFEEHAETTAARTSARTGAPMGAHESARTTGPSVATTGVATGAASLPRRTVLAVASGAVLSAVAGASRFGSGAALAATPEQSTAPNAGLVATALDCAGTGEVCIQHCLREFAKGDTTLAGCAHSVAEMVPVCRTLASLAALESSHLPAYAKVCIAVCESCEKECRKHEAHHAICKECADACVAVIAACKKI